MSSYLLKLFVTKKTSREKHTLSANQLFPNSIAPTFSCCKSTNFPNVSPKLMAGYEYCMEKGGVSGIWCGAWTLNATYYNLNSNMWNKTMSLFEHSLNYLKIRLCNCRTRASGFTSTAFIDVSSPLTFSKRACIESLFAYLWH